MESDLYDLQVEMAVRRRTSIRRLFVVADASELTKPLVKRVLDFHSRGTNFSCRTILLNDWYRITRELEVPDSSLDFGVWDDTVVYKAVRANADK